MSFNFDDGKVVRSGFFDVFDSVFVDLGVDIFGERGGVGVSSFEFEGILLVKGKDFGWRDWVSGIENNEFGVFIGVISFFFLWDFDGVSGNVVDGKFFDLEDGGEGSISEGGILGNSFILVKGEVKDFIVEELLDLFFNGRNMGRFVDKFDGVNLINGKIGFFKGFGKRDGDMGEEMVSEFFEGFLG